MLLKESSCSNRTQDCYRIENFRDALRALFLEKDFVKSLQELVSPGVEAAVSRAMEQRDAKIADLENKLTTTQEALTSAQDILQATQAKLAAMVHRVEEIDTDSRKNCVVISGVPELPEENTDRLAIDVAQAAGIALSSGDIDCSHRLGS